MDIPIFHRWIEAYGTSESNGRKDLADQTAPFRGSKKLQPMSTVTRGTNQHRHHVDCIVISVFFIVSKQ